MLKQLYKHEFLALLRWLFFIWIAIIALAVVTKCSNALLNIYIEKHTDSFSSNSEQAFGYINNLTYRLLLAISTSLTFIYVLAVIAAFILTLVVIVVRFYKNLYTSEGYFTFSIPVKPIQHLWCKLICGSVMFLASIIVIGLSVLITFISKDFISDLRLIVEQFKQAFFGIDKIHLLFYGIELVILLLVSLLASLLQFYCSISFGQSFKNKIGGSILSYILINVILNFAITFITIFGTLLLAIVGETPVTGPSSEQFAYLVMHVMMIGTILLQLGICAGFFVISAFRMKNKLNLE